jgi:hypothetical protein
MRPHLIHVHELLEWVEEKIRVEVEAGIWHEF